MKIRRIISAVLAVIMIITALPVAFAAGPDTVILYTNDVHCAIDNYSAFAAYKMELLSDAHTVITVDAGDAIQGEVVGLLTEGASIIDIMNRIGYDIAVPGNHEFDYGVDRFFEIANDEAQHQYICSNFYDLSNNKTVFDPYVIKEGENGEKIAFVGISTPETYTKTSPEYFQDENGNYLYGFPTAPINMTNEILYSTVQESVDAAEEAGADIVVAVGHLGIMESPDGWKSTDVIANTDGIDVFIDAHSEEVIENAVYKNKNNEDVVLTSAGRSFVAFGAITITADGDVTVKHVDPASIDVESMGASAQRFYEIVESDLDDIREDMAYLCDPIGTSEAELVTQDENGKWIVRVGETNMGDFVADAFCFVLSADIGLANGGSVRSTIKPGDVSRLDLMNVTPHGNDISVALLTGQQIVDALEHGARNLPEVSGGFLQVSSGLTYEIDVYKESPVIVDEVGNFIRIDETKERRVTNVQFLGRPIELDREYRVVGTTYLLANNGDGYTMFKDARVISPANSTDGQMLIMYLTQNLDGKIPADKYGNPEGEGRITINETAPEILCEHMCHKGGFMGFIWAIVRFFLFVFKANPVCECGAAHY